MKKSNIFGTANKRDVNPDWFTGKVWMKVLSDKTKSKRQDMYHVHFENGARTKLHMHNGPQILIVIDGNGSLDTYRGYGAKKSEFKIKKTESIRLNKGDVVDILPNVLHTHGSLSKTKDFSHIAINVFSPRSSEYKTDWFESDFKTQVTGKI